MLECESGQQHTRQFYILAVAIGENCQVCPFTVVMIPTNDQNSSYLTNQMLAKIACNQFCSNKQIKSSSVTLSY